MNPYTDFGFKLLFGTPMNKDLLIGFGLVDRVLECAVAG